VIQRRRRTGRWLLATAGLAAATLGAVLAGSPIQAPITIDRGQLLEDLRILSADDMEGRAIGTAGGARARAYILGRFRAAGIQPIGETLEWPFEAGRRGIAGANVAGVILGTKHPRHYLVISAHYDHIGTRNGTVFNGADDNASGTAALFAIAAHFARSKPETSLLFVAFDGEEPGLLGSRAFVRQPPVPRDDILFDLNVDMVGRETSNVLWVSGVRREPGLKPLVEAAARIAPLTLRMGFDDPANPQDDWTTQSDQWSFIQAGIPGVYVGVADEANHHRGTTSTQTPSAQ
jgi:Zn-dependent M28 family amino/carboxypeptidase